MTSTPLAPASSDPPEPFTDRLRLAVAAYLARHRWTPAPAVGALDIACDRRRAFSVVLVGNQIVDCLRLSRVTARWWRLLRIFRFCARSCCQLSEGRPDGGALDVATF